MEKLKPISQSDRILSYLRTHKTITPLEAQTELGCMRLAARIADLEKRGYKFSHKFVKKPNRYGDTVRVMNYALEEE